MFRVALHTLGCKVNQYETEKMAEDFLANDFELVDFHDQADVYVINSCTVTQTADSKSRRAVRSAAQRNPQAAVILTGCFAETTSEKIDGVAEIIGNREKNRLVERAITLLQSSGISPTLSSPAPETLTTGPLTRTRSLLKIQDGCDQFCAYCAVPLARPDMWSKPFEEVIQEANQVADKGYKEIVLVGIRLGRYEANGRNLTDLLEGLANVNGISRIRLSSIELTDIPEGLTELIASEEKVCRHLHIPLQSGDDEMLSRMNRPYTSSDFLSFVAQVREAVPDIGITTDIMVGFPGETSEQFENTCLCAQKAQFSRAHIFRYSPRPGTASASLPDDVSPAEKERRSENLTRITREDAHRFASRLLGKEVSILVEGKEFRPGELSGLTDNYIRVFFEADRQLTGSIVKVRIESVTEGHPRGIVV